MATLSDARVTGPGFHQTALKGGYTDSWGLLWTSGRKGEDAVVHQGGKRPYFVETRGLFGICRGYRLPPQQDAFVPHHGDLTGERSVASGSWVGCVVSASHSVQGAMLTTFERVSLSHQGLGV